MVREALLTIALMLGGLSASGRAAEPAPMEPARAPVQGQGEAVQAGAAQRRAVARRWAPTVYQEVLDPSRDLLTRFDFDGDWEGANNGAHAGRGGADPVVYFAVIETSTHWFVHYLLYHPVDYKRIEGHLHDTESVLAVVRRAGAPLGRLEALETRFHARWFQYAAAGAVLGDGLDDIDGPIHVDVDGRPAVYAQRMGHGLCGGFAPPGLVAELDLRCDHDEPPRLQGAGLVYVPEGAATRARREGAPVAEYALVDLFSSLWPVALAHDAQMYGRFGPYAGARCRKPGWSCPREIGLTFADGGRGSAPAPWAQTPGPGGAVGGDQFFDPAETLGRRLRFPRPFSRAYQWNPYVGIGGAATPRRGSQRLATPAPPAPRGWALGAVFVGAALWAARRGSARPG